MINMMDEPTKVYDNLQFEGAEILPGGFRNFSGRGDKFNPEGKRYFNVLIPDAAMAEKLAADGWNIRYTRSDDPDIPGDPYMKINIKYKEGSNRNPKIYKVSSKNATLLDEETVGSLDYDEIRNADIFINPYNWGPTADGKYGVTGYVDVMYVNIVDNDPFADKYASKRDDISNDGPKDEDVPF